MRSLTLQEAKKKCALGTVCASYYSKLTGEPVTVRVRGFTQHRDASFTIHTNYGTTEPLTADRVSFNS